MYRWGHIRCLRFDNGRPFGDPTRTGVSACALNLIARGCEVLFNPPRSPTKNAKVERCQGTTSRWADAPNCADIDQFRLLLEYAVEVQRERLPTRVCKGLTRAEYYPDLFNNPRRYDPTDFDITRVFRYLAKGKWYRKVSSAGHLSMFATKYQVGYAHRRKTVSVSLELDAQKPYWIFSDENQNQLAKFHAQNICQRKFYDLS